MPRLIDTHCHLNLADSFPEPEREIELAREAGVDKLLVVGIDEPSNLRALELAERFESVYAIVGWHPNSAAAYTPAVLGQIAEWAGHPKAAAIGEIGLDYHWDFATPEQQERCLLDQFDLAASLGMPVVFHCREAYPSLLTLLESRSDAVPTNLLFHCFSGDESDLQRAMDLGAYFGIDGPITYKKSAELRRLAQLMPQDRIVLETDSPYLAPEPLRGRPNVPANLVWVNRALAATLGISEERCAEVTTANAERFFGL